MPSESFGNRPTEKSDTLTYNGISINKNFIIYYQDIDSDYHSYTFPVLKNPEKGGFDNILISYHIETNSYKDFLVHYDVTELERELLNTGKEVQNIEQKVNFQQLDENYFSEMLLGKIYYEDGCYYSSHYFPDHCCSGQHIYGEACNCTEAEGQAQDSGETFMTFLGCPNGDGGDAPSSPPSSTSGPNHPGGSNSHSTLPASCRKCIENEEDEEEEILTSCEKIKKAFEDFPNLKTKLQAIKTKTSETVEHGFYALKGGSGIEDQAPGTNGKIDFNQNPLKKYVIIAHSHNSLASETYSVFSWDDLYWLANAIRKGSIKTSKFVMFLTTADGTNYALTISNRSSFKNFFADMDNMSLTEQAKFSKMEQVQKNAFSKKEAPIKESNQTTTELANEEREFLKMLQNADLGAEVFEFDANFENPKELSLTNPNIGNPTVSEANCE
ncbi:hypothetical protein ACFQ3R_05575 [Mesonia ostreae]|uniref:Uncharacterized protein n=1 Tax=Mesonia ostreae TaxID=861110 RepID=A0ABU2KJV9_9FLAO|nr:hypothetical protein [Mesonia ostreae]MDT0295007.1 hypothetical protein [Mesonia ostreae]